MQHPSEILIALFLAIVFLTGCSGEKEQSELLTVNLKNCEFKTFAVEDLIDESRIIEFDQREKIVAGGSEVICYNDRGIFLLDKYINRQVILFSNDGSYIGAIGKPGGGPGEYIIINDAIVLNDRIDILSFTGKVKIISYSLNGQYESYKELSVPKAFSFEYDRVNNKYLFYVSNNPEADGRLLVYDIATEKISQAFFKPKTNFPPYEVKTFFRNENGSIYYWEPFHDYVYKAGADSLEKVMFLDWGNRQPLNEMNMQEFLERMSSDEIYIIKNVITSDDYQLVNIVKNCPGLTPELLQILIADKKLFTFTIAGNENFNISPAQYIRDHKILYLIEPLNDKNNNSRLKKPGYTFCLELDITKLLSKFTVNQNN